VADFSLKNILPAAASSFSEGVYIILFNATSIPPHLLLSVNNKIYSITDSGRQLGSSLEKLIAFVQRKKVPSIFVEWKELENWNPGKLESLIREKFSNYDRVVEGKISCLFPIRDVVAEILGNDFQKANFIFELLPLMENKNSLGKIYGMNMGTAIVNGEFQLLTYSDEDLKQSLQSAQSFPK
jgi:hypothetical protein